MRHSLRFSHPPYVYEFAAHLAGRMGRDRVVALGCVQQGALVEISNRVEIIGIDVPGVFRQLRPADRCEWIEWGRRRSGGNDHLVSDADLTRSVVVCAGVLDRGGSAGLWSALRRSAELAGAVVVTCTTDAVPGRFASDETAADQWFRELLRTHGLEVLFLGRAVSAPNGPRETLMAVVTDRPVPTPGVTPSDFRVIAIVPMFNEVDVIRPMVDRLLAERMEVVIVDNWSTDGSSDLVRELYGNAPTVRLERFPSDGPAPTFSWMSMLQRVETIGARSGADWVIKSDADELREGPWESVGLRDSLYSAQMQGYNSVDFTKLNFRPTDGSLSSDEDPVSRLRHFEFGGHGTWRLPNMNAWQSTGVPASLAHSGGHEVTFEGRRVFPYNFLLRHYPLRSQAQAEQKVTERRVRLEPEKRELGWHIHYDHLEDDHVYSWDPNTVLEWNARFASRYLIERLTGITH